MSRRFFVQHLVVFWYSFTKQQFYQQVLDCLFVFSPYALQSWFATPFSAHQHLGALALRLLIEACFNLSRLLNKKKWSRLPTVAYKMVTFVGVPLLLFNAHCNVAQAISQTVGFNAPLAEGCTTHTAPVVLLAAYMIITSLLR